jgi:hypothetical protein
VHDKDSGEYGDAEIKEEKIRGKSKTDRKVAAIN